MTNREYDELLRREEGIALLCGVDEAGRGPLAGPVFAAAVIFRPGETPQGLDDSKKLSEKKRDALFDVICNSALTYGIASASVEEIEELNILQATFLAMRRAVDMLSVTPDRILIDGNRVPPELSATGRYLIKGDSLSASIGAASILAKVSRDRYMLEMDARYPQYAFAKHKGYGTALHYERLAQYGLSPIHRPSFLKKIL
ncbi:MAG: ribonuclease HII [Clostridia bacterium]|nr:ribonuclease HII [Clostridia bacterium]